LQDAKLERTLTFRGDLSQSDVRGMEREGVLAVGLSMACQDLAALRLRRCQLTDARMDECDLQAADLTQACFKGAWLRQANLQGVKAARTMFVKADLQRAQCRGGDFQQSLWSDSFVEESDFS